MGRKGKVENDMKKIKIAGKEYILEFTFEAAEIEECVKRMFMLASGGHILARAETAKTELELYMESTSDMVGDVPKTCVVAFHAGLQEHHSTDAKESKELMKAYMKENKLNYAALFEEIKDCMEEDDFFGLSGITKMLEDMETNIEAEEQKQNKKEVKTPQDHKKKQTSTK